MNFSRLREESWQSNVATAYLSRLVDKSFIHWCIRTGILLIALLIVSIQMLSANDLQEQTVSGKVLSLDDSSPLPGVSVFVKGTQTGTVTDADGNYSIGVPSGTATLVFSFMGYKTTEVAVDGRGTVDISIESDITQLGEVVVTSFGIEQSKQSVGFAVQYVDGAAIALMRQPNVVSSLQGQVSGVQITNSGGAPGMSARILIRGITSLDPKADNQP